MRKSQAKTVNRTFSLPTEVAHELHVYIKHREMSHFVSEAIKKELAAKKNELKAAYIAMSQDKNQLETMQEWDGTVADGFEEE